MFFSQVKFLWGGSAYREMDPWRLPPKRLGLPVHALPCFLVMAGKQTVARDLCAPGEALVPLFGLGGIRSMRVMCLSRVVAE